MKFIALVFLFLFSLSTSAQVRLTPAQLKSLDSIAVQDVPPGAPGIATAIIQNGKVIFSRCAGYADLNDSSFITSRSRFNMASNGKQFTALAILTLLEQKKISLNNDIRDFFPELFKQIPNRITIAQLLNHTSGIRDCYDLWSLQGYTWWEKTFSNADVLQLISRQEQLNFTPGSQYLYSNTNYILLALLIEKVSRKSFIAFTNELFQQLRMPNTSFENDYTAIRGPVAKAYFNFSSWTTYNWIWNVCGDGNFFSTLEDQIQWEKIVQGKGKTTISKSLIRKSQEVIEGSKFENYGFGLERGTYKDLPYTFHEGATGAWKATVIRFPQKKISMITLTNTGKSIPSMQTRQMADVVFGLKTDAAYFITQPAAVGKLVKDEEIPGTYITSSNFVFQFENRNGKIFLKRSGRNDVELEREADNILHQKNDPLFKQEFTTSPEGKLQVTAYYINHAPYTLTKVNADFSSVDFGKLAGSFLNTETNARFQILTSGTNVQVVTARQDTINALLITPETLKAGNYTYQLEKNNGTVLLALLDGDRIRNVMFVREKQ